MGWCWVDHQLRTVVIGGDEDDHARKGSGKGKTKKGGAVFPDEDREFCLSYCFANIILLNVFFRT